MTTNNFGKAYEAYQQAVYRDGKNPAFWCSIGVLYYNINQYHDALDAYSRAIRIHPYLAEVWYNLGALYEACNDQMTDAIDAYQRTLQLDPSNAVVAQRLNEIRDHQTSGVPLSPPPPPRDISPSSMSWSYATNSGGAPTQLAQAGLGPELSPSMGPPPPSSSVQARVPTSGSGGSPHGNAQSRFDGMPVGSRPRSTDPYRRSAIQHSPSGYPAGSSPRHSASLAPGHRLPPYKDGRVQPNGRLGSPPSPRSRVPDGHLAGPSGSSYPFPSHLSGGVQAREGSHDGMDWDRSRNGLRNGSAAPGSRGSNLHPPTLGQPPSYPPPSHPHQHPHAPPQPYGQAARSPHLHSAVGQHAANGGHYERAGPSAPAAARPPFFDNPSPGPYGAYPPAGTSAAAEEFARRRSSGSTNGSHRDSKPSIPSLDAAIAAPSAPSPATPATAPTAKGRGSRKKAEGGAEAPKKGGRRGKAAANAAASAGDSADGSASGANTPKKRRAKAAPKAAQKEQAPAVPPQDKDDEAAAKAAAAAAAALDASPRPAPAAPAPSTANEAAAAPSSREVDEEYDEGVDALMSLGGGARSEASPPARAAPVTEEAESTAPTPANSRKRSLPIDEPAPAAVGGEATAQAQPDESSEPDAKRARPDPAVPQPDSESVPQPPPPAPRQDNRDPGVLGPALTEKANFSADATEETQARKEAASEGAAAPKQDSTAEPVVSAAAAAESAPREEDKENVGESTTPDKDKLPAVATVGPDVLPAAEIATTTTVVEAGTPKEVVGEVAAAAEAVPVDAAATAA